MNQAWFWQLGLTFMFIPGLINLMMWIYRFCSGRRRYSWRWWAVTCAVTTPLYPLCVISGSIYTAVKTLRGEVDEKTIKLTKELKLIEIIGE